MCVHVFVSARSISASPFSVASVASVFVSIQLLISVSAAVPVMMFMINVASITLVISGRRPAAASVWGIAPQAPPCGGVSGSGLASAALQAGGAQRVEEEAFVGASQRTFQPEVKDMRLVRRVTLTPATIRETDGWSSLRSELITATQDSQDRFIFKSPRRQSCSHR